MQTPINLKLAKSPNRYMHWFGLSFIVLFVAEVLFNIEGLDWYNYGYLFIGVMYLVVWWAEKSKQFDFQVTETLLIHNRTLWFDKTIELNQISEVRKFGGEHIFRDSEKEIRIPLKALEDESIEKLEKWMSESSVVNLSSTDLT